MPYILKGTTVYKKENGRMVSKGKSKDKATAKKHLRLLLGLESGWTPTQNR